MEHEHRIQEAQSRAERLNLTMHAVCRTAGVAPQSFWRWARGESFQQRNFASAMRRIEAELDRLEDDLFQYLSARRPRRAEPPAPAGSTHEACVS